MNIPFDTADQATNWAITWLRGGGYEVRKIDQRPPEMLAQIAARLGIGLKSLSRSLHRAHFPIPVTINRGPSGRIITIVSNQEFDAYFLSRKKS